MIKKARCIFILTILASAVLSSCNASSTETDSKTTAHTTTPTATTTAVTTVPPATTTASQITTVDINATAELKTADIAEIRIYSGKTIQTYLADSAEAARIIAAVNDVLKTNGVDVDGEVGPVNPKKTFDSSDVWIAVDFQKPLTMTFGSDIRESVTAVLCNVSDDAVIIYLSQDQDLSSSIFYGMGYVYDVKLNPDAIKSVKAK
ncbi:MAG: hypothetical protein QM689_12160 [Oscillospiraceae bacterium]